MCLYISVFVFIFVYSRICICVFVRGAAYFFHLTPYLPLVSPALPDDTQSVSATGPQSNLGSLQIRPTA